MNILDEAARQNREIVTRDGRKPDWIQRAGDFIWYYVAGTASPMDVHLDGYAININSPIPRRGDLILAPKKATFHYLVKDGELWAGPSTSPYNEIHGSTAHSVTVDL